jgi:hypothetical protein
VDAPALTIRTYREGVAAKAGHDLVLGVERCSATAAADGMITVEADPSSLVIQEALHGVKPLSDRDREEIRRNIREKVLGTSPIVFRGTLREGVAVGDLTIAGRTRPVTVPLTVDGDRVGGRFEIVQSEWGIRPYRGLLGALKVRDTVEVEVTGRLPG